MAETILFYIAMGVLGFVVLGSVMALICDDYFWKRDKD